METKSGPVISSDSENDLPLADLSQRFALALRLPPLEPCGGKLDSDDLSPRSLTPLEEKRAEAVCSPLIAELLRYRGALRTAVELERACGRWRPLSGGVVATQDMVEHALRMALPDLRLSMTAARQLIPRGVAFIFERPAFMEQAAHQARPARWRRFIFHVSVQRISKRTRQRAVQVRLEAAHFDKSIERVL